MKIIVTLTLLILFQTLSAQQTNSKDSVAGVTKQRPSKGGLDTTAIQANRGGGVKGIIIGLGGGAHRPPPLPPRQACCDLLPPYGCNCTKHSIVGVTDEKGQFGFKINETGDWYLQLNDKDEKSKEGKILKYGARLTGVLVKLFDLKKNEIITKLITDKDGFVEFKGLDAGNYYIELLPTKSEPLTPIEQSKTEIKKSAVKKGE